MSLAFQVTPRSDLIQIQHKGCLPEKKNDSKPKSDWYLFVRGIQGWAKTCPRPALLISLSAQIFRFKMQALGLKLRN